MQRTHADPAHRHSVAGAGSRRPRVLPLLVVGVLVAACVRGLLVESVVAPSDALAPAVQPGDRVLVWKAGADPRPGDVRHSQADNAVLRSLFPEVEPVTLDTGLAETVAWFKETS